MKKKILLIIAGIIIAGASGAVGYTIFLTEEPKLSVEQQLIVNGLGKPDQFVISYVPRGDNDLVRLENWYYDGAGKALSFLAGKLVGSQDYQPTGKPATSLDPEEFDYFMNSSNVEAVLGNKNIARMETGSTESYLSDQAMFVIENGKLTYFQTINAQKNK